MRQNALFIIGAQRSGSTYLFHLLDEHPEISLVKPVRPEPKTFLSDASLVSSLDEYFDRYYGSVGSKVKYIGEKTTSYLESVEAARRIHACCPEARLLVILRNPVDRAHSNYRFSVENGIENVSFRKALAVETERLQNTTYRTSVNPYAYRTRGEYARYLAPYLSIFTKNQVRICILEELLEDRSNLADMYTWLGVEADFVPTTYGSTVNASLQKSDMDSEVKRWLIGQYAESLRELETMVGRTIDVWRKAWGNLQES